jgi:DNA-binding Lrp family transcriptional regulator
VRGKLSTLERRLLDEAQRGFPVCSRPYAELGQIVGCSEQEAYDTIHNLRQRGIIRRIGGIFDSGMLGYTSELVAMKVPRERLDEVAQLVNEYEGVTHNYERDGEYNLWFTITAKAGSELNRCVAEIKGRTGVNEILRLPASRMFKSRVVLPFGE